MKNYELDISISNSRKTYIPIYLMVGTLIVIIVLIKYEGLPLQEVAVLGAVVFVILCIGFSEIHRVGRSYKITKDFMVYTEGYLNKKTKKISLLTISDIDIQQSFWQRIMGFGNVKVHIFSEGSTIKLKGISFPAKFAELLEDTMNKKAERGRR